MPSSAYRVLVALLGIAFFATPVGLRAVGVTAHPFENRVLAGPPKLSQGFDAFDKTIVLVEPEDSDGGKQSAPLGAALGVNDRLALVGPLADPITASGILHSQVSSKQLGLQPIRFLAQCCGNRIVQSG